MHRRDMITVMVLSAAAAIVTKVPVLADEAPILPSNAELLSVLRLIFPHDALPDRFYIPAVEALSAAAAGDRGVAALLGGGWQDLNGPQPAWGFASHDERIDRLASLESAGSFALLRQTMVFTFYTNPELWDRFGYDGDAWRFGGFLGRGVDTIDWLPPVPAE